MANQPWSLGGKGMSTVSRWLNWTPRQRQIMETSPEVEPTKPSKRTFVGFEGSVSRENPIIRAPETPPASVPTDTQTTAESGGALSGEPLPTRPCYTCHSNRWWVSVNGPIVCATCHPPANPALVQCWYELPIMGKSLTPEPTKPTKLPAPILSGLGSKAP
jgi:hypothetical protein